MQESQGKTTRLETPGAGASDTPGFVALAESLRREGRADDALKVVNEGLRDAPDGLAARVVRALTLLDLERSDEARDELAEVLLRAGIDASSRALSEAEPVFDATELDTPELDDAPAYAPAPPLDDETIFAPVPPASDAFGDLGENELEAAFDAAEARPEEMIDVNHVAEATLRDVEADGPERVVSGSESPFATETMAQLLEEQGHADQAENVRATLSPLDADAPSEDASTTSRGGRRMVETLERWLDNLRRDA